MDEMRDDVRRRLERVRRGEQLVSARDQILDAYLDRADVPVPARMLAHELEHRGEAVQRELDMYGLQMENYLEAQGKTAEEFEAEAAKSATTAIKAQFVLGALATHEQLSVDEGELTSHMINRAQRAGMTPDQYVQQVMQSGNIQGLVSEVVQAKALALLVREAKVTDSNGDEVDVVALEAELGSPTRTAQSQVFAGADDEDGDDDVDAISQIGAIGLEPVEPEDDDAR
jgi:trigger factor